MVLEVFQLPDTSNCYIYKVFVFGETYFGERYNKNWTLPSLNNFDVYNAYPCSSNLGGIAFDNQSLLVYQKGSGALNCPASISKSLNTGGQPVWTKQYDGYIFTDLTVSGNQIFICSNQGLLVMDENGEITAQFDDLLLDRIKPMNNTNLLLQKEDTLVQISLTGELLDTLFITDGHLQDFDTQHGKTGILTTTGHYYIYDDLLNLEGDFQLAHPSLEYTHTQVGKASVFLSGKYNAGQGIYHNDAVFAKEYTFNGEDISQTKDIGVVGITHGQEVTINQISGYYKYQVIFDSVVVAVKNYGDTYIKGEYLSAGFQFPSTTEEFVSSFTRQFYYGIEAGETRYIPWGKVYLNFHEPPSGPFDLCMWSALPADGLDINPSNDVGCADFFVSTENRVLQPAVKIYPNPASNQLFIETGTPLLDGSTWTLYDLYGKAAVHAELSSGIPSHTIDLPSLPTGLYGWHLTGTDGAVTSGKLVIAQ